MNAQAVRRLLALVPTSARLVRNGREEEVPLEKIQPGDLVAQIVTVTFREGVAEPDGIREAVIERAFRLA